MNRSDTIPRIFAILRTNAYRGPQIQIFQANFHEYRGYYIIEPLTQADLYSGSQETLRISTLPRRIMLNERVFNLKFMNQETHAIMDVKYWHLPFVIRQLDIPFLEFQYRSWIPRSQDDLQFTTDIHMHEILRIMESVQEARLETIRRIEDSEYTLSEYRHPYHHLDGPDDHDDRRHNQGGLVGATRYRNTRSATPPPPPEIRIVQVEVPVERIVIQTHAKPLPKAVGDILIANARAGTDSCPIAAITFKECTKLSITSCFHVFDFESLSKWQETHSTCPVCRAKIENVVSE